MPREPLHTFRASDALWDEAMEVAHENGENLSAVLRRALEVYRDHGHLEGRDLIRAMEGKEDTGAGDPTEHDYEGANHQ